MTASDKRPRCARRNSERLSIALTSAKDAYQGRCASRPTPLAVKNRYAGWYLTLSLPELVSLLRLSAQLVNPSRS